MGWYLRRNRARDEQTDGKRSRYDLLFGAQMYRAWVDLLPGSHWLSWLGLVETIAYGVFFGLVFARLYNFFLVKVWRHVVMTSHVAAAAPTRAQAVAKKLEIDEVIGGVPPDQKVEGIKRLRNEGRFVAMAGDAMIAAAAMSFGLVSVIGVLRLRRAHV